MSPRSVSAMPHFQVVLALLLSAAAQEVSAWNTSYYTTFNYSTKVVDPVPMEQRLIDGMNHLLSDEGMAATQRGCYQTKQQAVPARARTLFAVTTSNVWDRTFGLLMSLANTPDEFDLLVVDECSTDGTREELARLNATVLHVNETKGVTYHWNLIYEHFLDHGYENLIISNNDVLVPPGAVSRLVSALEEGNDCDLVSPLSTVNGKGHIGIMEGLEAVYNLSIPAARKVEVPYNYARVQAALDALYSPDEIPVFPRVGDFNGFFFAVSKKIAKAAAGPRNLFSDQLFSFRQEKDLSSRMDQQGMKRCLHLGAFVFHYKASTIAQGPLTRRERFKAACELLQEQTSRPMHTRRT